MALLNFGEVIFSETADISWLQSKKLPCLTAMQWHVRADITDGFR